MSLVRPVILSGGSGSRLWPLSRESYPKQLLRLAGERTLFQETLLRTLGRPGFGPPIAVANAEHRFVVAEQVREAGCDDARLILEPVARNTAPAVLAAALSAEADDPEAIVLVMPADHHVPDAAAFRAAVEQGLPAARAGRLVLFGVAPTRPATGYGYIRRGDRTAGAACEVAAFVEKPDLPTAERFLADGRHLWNSGVFLLPVRTLLDEARLHAPEILDAVRAAHAGARRDLDFLRLDPKAFERSPSLSIDYAVMERTDRAAVVPVEFAWTDVGSWSALWELGDRDASGNLHLGDVVSERSDGCYLRSEGPLVAALGVRDLIVVATKDAVLVADKGSDQEVKAMVDRLRRSGHRAVAGAPRVHRPWGWYEGIDEGERFLVKRIMVRPGERLSLQKHAHRAEHWVVVQGVALVTVGDERRTLSANESVYIPAGSVHRLENPGEDPLHLIEVQSGDYLGEDDIVRLEDAYART